MARDMERLALHFIAVFAMLSIIYFALVGCRQGCQGMALPISANITLAAAAMASFYAGVYVAERLMGAHRDMSWHGEAEFVCAYAVTFAWCALYAYEYTYNYATAAAADPTGVVILLSRQFAHGNMAVIAAMLSVELVFVAYLGYVIALKLLGEKPR